MLKIRVRRDCTMCDGTGRISGNHCGACRGVGEVEYDCPELLEAAKAAIRLILELGASPLALAAKYGPDYEPASPDEIGQMCRQVEEAIAKTEGRES